MCAGGEARENLQQVLKFDEHRTRAHQASVVLPPPSSALASDQTKIKGLVSCHSFSYILCCHLSQIFFGIMMPLFFISFLVS